MEEGDILSDSLHLIGGTKVEDHNKIRYGPINITIAPKEGKALSLLADQLFSPSLALADMLEAGELDCKDKTWLELGSGTGLVSLVAACLNEAPRLMVLTDYPDPAILKTLQENVDVNKPLMVTTNVVVEGYEWGSAGGRLRSYTKEGFDIMILSDLLYFDKSHGDLLKSVDLLLARTLSSRVYVGAGKYTPRVVCDSFLQQGTRMGLVWEELETADEWRGRTQEGTYGVDDLQARKNNSWLWIGRWETHDENVEREIKLSPKIAW